MKKFVIDYQNQIVELQDGFMPVGDGSELFGRQNSKNLYELFPATELFDDEQDALEVYLGEILCAKKNMFLLEYRVMNRILELTAPKHEVEIS